jgi:SAM-dependent methyltransferase
VSTPWSPLGDRFLSDGVWAIGQGPDAPDRQLLRHLLRNWDAADPTMIEVGCGPGIEVEGLEAAGLLDTVFYTGFDFTPELVDRCRERFPDVGFEVRDVLTLDEAPADVVWVRHLLEHVDDGELALRNLWAATGELLIVSWFIRPTWQPDEVGCVVADGFQHWTYDARRWVGLARELGAHLYRFDIDHHANRGSVWILSRQREPRVAAAAHDFLRSDAFLAALVPVPPDPQERLNDALDVLEGARAALSDVVPVAERVADLTRLLRDDGVILAAAFTVLAQHADDDDLLELAGSVNEASARTKAAFSERPDPEGTEAVQAARDARARVDSILAHHGRLQ